MDMLSHRRMLVLVVGAALALAVAFVLPKTSSAAPPEPVDVTATIPGCEFPVLAEVSGKSKVIDLPRCLLQGFQAHNSLILPCGRPRRRLTKKA
jgi:hypothetical protein